MSTVTLAARTAGDLAFQDMHIGSGSFAARLQSPDAEQCQVEVEASQGSEMRTLLIQGRVLSADNNIHLSPPGGSRVLIDDTYRAAGGTNTGTVGLSVEGDIRAGTTTLECAWTACFDTGNAYFTCAQRKPGYPIMGGIDISTDDGQKPYGCTGTDHEDEIRLYCCRLATP